MQSGRLVRRRASFVPSFLFSRQIAKRSATPPTSRRRGAILSHLKRPSAQAGRGGGGEGGGSRNLPSCRHQQPSFGCCQNQAPVISVCLPAASAQTRPVSTTLALAAAHSPSSPLYPSAPLPTVLASSYASEICSSCITVLFPPPSPPHCWGFFSSLSLLSP